MNKAEAVRRLREPELRAMGIRQLSLFGSVARGDETERSDVDLAAIDQQPRLQAQIDRDRVRVF